MTIHPTVIVNETDRIATVTCDTEGCPHDFKYHARVDAEHWKDGYPTPEIVRRAWRKAGWTQLGKNDLCPTCSKAPNIVTDGKGRALNKVDYGEGVYGFTSRISGPTSTT